MTPAAQNTVIRALLALPVFWIVWDAVRAMIGALVVLFVAPPSERELVTTVFLLAYGFVPALAMVGCALLAGALMLRYPEQGRAKSLAFLCVCVGLVFGQFFLPMLFSELRRFDVPILPPLPIPESIEVLTVFVGIALAPVFLFWFSACFPDEPVTGAATGPVAALARVQSVALRTPAVILVGALPVLVVALSGGAGAVIVMTGAATFAVAFGSLWLTHRTVAKPSLERTVVVAVSLAAPVAPLLLAPLTRYLPRYSPFFSFDAAMLVVAAGLCAMVFGLTYAVFVKGAVGPGLVVRRGLLVGGAGMVALFLFAGIESVASDYLLEAMGLPTRLGTFIAAGILAVGITQIRDRLRPG